MNLRASIGLFLPETILLVLSTALLCLMLAKKESSQKALATFMQISAVILLAATLTSLKSSGSIFFDTYRVDLLSQGSKCMLAMAFLFTLMLSQDMISVRNEHRLEYFLFLSSATLGMMMVTSAVDFLTFYVSLELSSYSLYLLTVLRQGRRNAEAGTKYLILGAASSGTFLWGASLIMGLAGSTSLLEISKHALIFCDQPAFFVGLIMVLSALLFKLSSFPVHFWAPDVYESASTPVAHFIATASKGTAVAILIRVLILVGVSDALGMLLGILAFFSMTLGNAVALTQRDVKRLLAYSSIAQAGYLLVGILPGSPEGFSSGFFYALAYILMNAGAFVVTILVAKSARHDNPQLEHFDGLAERSPFLALLLLLCLLSLAGIPPLVGFTGKWILFSAAMEKGYWFLVLWGVLNSVVSLFYYLTIVKHVYLEKPKESAPIPLTAPLKALGLFLLLAIVLLGVFPNPLISFAQQAVSGMPLR